MPRRKDDPFVRTPDQDRAGPMTTRLIGPAVMLACAHVLVTTSIPMTWRMVRRPFMYCPYCAGDA